MTQEPEQSTIMHFDSPTYPVMVMKEGSWWVEYETGELAGPFNNVFELNAHIKENHGENHD